ncbi:hypothetical protein XHV734_1833 [Xanthomonas hortorum pv. vitians]|nr:hypothetical protein XHV734_1833 [Xanthomonas hortorum pv. vitians]
MSEISSVIRGCGCSVRTNTAKICRENVDRQMRHDAGPMHMCMGLALIKNVGVKLPS